jgi:glycosyltransferase involved in cell wall biosynthesis
MARASSLSVVVPALNEERNLAETLRTIEAIVPEYFEEWEILVFNDGSRDRTGEVADKEARRNPRIRVTHHPSPRNLGGCYRAGEAGARMEYLILDPGDGECGAETLRPVLSRAGQADMIVPYVENPEIRPLFRRWLSRLFIGVLNRFTPRKLRYYNGTVLHRTRLVRACGFRTDGFGYQAELLIRLLARGLSYLEVGTRLRARGGGVSKAFHPRNLVHISRFIVELVFIRQRPVNIG